MTKGTTAYLLSTVSWLAFFAGPDPTLKPLNDSERGRAAALCNGAIGEYARRDAFVRSRLEAGVAGG